jgi:hypothetical protein
MTICPEKRMTNRMISGTKMNRVENAAEMAPGDASTRCPFTNVVWDRSVGSSVTAVAFVAASVTFRSAASSRFYTCPEDARLTMLTESTVE